MNVMFLDTKVLNDTHYVDLIDINGALHAFLMHKISEPNVFGVLIHQEGDTRTTIGKDVVLSGSNEPP